MPTAAQRSRPARLSTRSYTHLQRRYGDGRRTDSAESHRGGATPRSSPRRPDPGRTRGARSGGVDGAVALGCARVDAAGEPVLLWTRTDPGDWVLIRRGPAALQRAEALSTEPGPSTQAAIAACHARALTAEATDWSCIACCTKAGRHLSLAGGGAQSGSRRRHGLRAGSGIGVGRRLSRCPPALVPPAPQRGGDLLAKLGRWDEARTEFRRGCAEL